MTAADPATLDDYRWLVSDAARPWLAQARDELQHAGLSPRYLQRLRQDLSAERAHLVVEQVEPRQRAREKFSQAERMFFTRKGLEQATDEVLANYKAARFPEIGLADLCCGIGGDFMSLVQRATAGIYAVDRDPIVLALTSANAHLLSRRSATFVPTSAADWPILVYLKAWHCDPDRRVEGNRTTQIDLCEPPLEALDEMRTRNANAAIKLAPATEVPPHWWDVCEREWLGSRGE